MAHREVLLEEMATNAANLVEQSNRAAENLELTPGEFTWFRSEISHPMNRRRIWHKSIMLHDSLTSSATLHDGQAVMGHVYACVNEPLPKGELHQASGSELPVPFVPRLLTANRELGLITVDTLTTKPPTPDEGPFVTELGARYRFMTVYDAKSDDVRVKSGIMFAPAWGAAMDLTEEQDALKLPDKTLLTRLAIVVRTIKATTAILEQIAQQASSVQTQVISGYSTHQSV